jgi:hypothetical protein
MSEKCNSTIKFADDYMDNETTFHCQLERGHRGFHKETGDGGTAGGEYMLTWYGEAQE